MRKTVSGFTIVELLIVIVVIAILAVISVVAYNGIQDRSTNASSKAAANQAEKLIRSYVIANSSYPYTGRTCATESSCYFGGLIAVNAAFRTNITTIGNLPGGVPTWNTTYGGVFFDYVAGRTYEGVPSPGVVVYFLRGANLDCGQEVGNTISGTTMTKSTTSNSGYIGGTAPTTFCYVPLRGLE